MNKNVELLNQEDVIKVKNEKTKWVITHSTFTVNDLTSGLTQKFGGNEELMKWSKEGVEANVLVEGKSWRQGKVRLSMEFIPDENIEPPSLLDDFRK
ncbi:KGK domain-containing protein [Geminocystis herdmanii]|uniref:KGK domain-containing protein n=1 Tax=Geminocystis herdmanii TaxID=669359 RepID=UPI00034C6931|nr:KGK domain-containing protein [Geminocystis herdmanii]